MATAVEIKQDIEQQTQAALQALREQARKLKPRPRAIEITREPVTGIQVVAPSRAKEFERIVRASEREITQSREQALAEVERAEKEAGIAPEPIQIGEPEFDVPVVKLQTGEYIAQEEYEKLSPKDKDYLQQHGIEAFNVYTEKQLQEFQKDHIQLKSGDWIRADKYWKMSPADRTLIDKVGIDKFNETKQAAFEASNVKLDNGEYVPKTEWDSLSLSDQKLLQQVGVDAFNKQQTQTAVPTLAEVPESKKDWFRNMGMEILTFGSYVSPDEAKYDYWKAAEIAAMEGKMLVTEEGTPLTEEMYVQQVTSQQPTAWEAGREWLPFSQFWIPGRTKELVSEGVVGKAKLAGYTALDIATVVPIIGWGAKGISVLLKGGSAGAKIAALGGIKTVEALAKEATANVAKVEEEITVKRAAVKEATINLDKAIIEKAPAIDIANWQKAVTVAKQELATTISQHEFNVAAAKVESATLNDLLKTAEKESLSVTLGGKAYTGAIKTVKTSSLIVKPAMYTFGAINLGTTIVERNKLSPLGKILGASMSAIAFGIPGKIAGGLKSQYELATSPGRIPKRTIEVPSIYVPKGAGMPKTSVAGMNIEKQLQAFRTSTEAMEKLWKGEGKVSMVWDVERGLKYAPESEFQRVVPQTMISATPAGEAFARGVYEVATIKEPAQFFSTWGFPEFAETSATGLKGTRPTYLALFSEKMSKFPKYIWEAPTPKAMRSRAEAWYRTGAEPGTYPGYKLYRLWKEPEFTVPQGTMAGEAEAGIDLWTRASPFGAKISIKPYYIMAEAEARRAGFTIEEATKFKSMGLGLEFKALKNILSFKRGIAGEHTVLSSLKDALSELRDFRSELKNRLEELRRTKAPANEIRAIEEQIRIIDEDIATGVAREGILANRMKRAIVERLTTGTIRGTPARIGAEAQRIISAPRTQIAEYVSREVRATNELGRRIAAARQDALRRMAESTLVRGIGRVEREKLTSRVEFGRVEPTRPPREEYVPREERPPRLPTIERLPRAERLEETARPPRVPPSTRPPRVPPPETGLPTKIEPPSKEGIEEVEPEELPVGTVFWKQGLFWIAAAPPYSKVMTISKPPVKNVVWGTGKGSAYKTLGVVGGKFPDEIWIDMGVVDIHITKVDNKPAIEFLGKGERTYVSGGVSPTKGLKVIGKPEGKPTITEAELSSLQGKPVETGNEGTALLEGGEERPIMPQATYKKSKKSKRHNISSDSYVNPYLASPYQMLVRKAMRGTIPPERELVNNLSGRLEK